MVLKFTSEHDAHMDPSQFYMRRCHLNFFFQLSVVVIVHFDTVVAQVIGLVEMGCYVVIVFYGLGRHKDSWSTRKWNSALNGRYLSKGMVEYILIAQDRGIYQNFSNRNKRETSP